MVMSRGTPSQAASHRLDRFYGDVSECQNEAMIELIPPGVERILDVGCGLGNFTDKLEDKGYTAIGFDIDLEILQVSKKRNEANILVCGDAYRLPFGEGAFDYAVIREAAHHFDMDQVLTELSRVVCRGLIIFDPNPTGIVRLSRRIIAHEDGEAPAKDVIALLRKHSFTVRSIQFRDVLAFPLSGGFVGPELVPNFEPVKKFILMFDAFLTSVARKLRLERFLCWRYVLEAQKMSMTE